MIRKRHWLKGDCHLYTTNSDGKHTPGELYDMLYDAGFDFAFITDHNVNTPGKKSFVHRGVAIFPGMEISGGLGHVNVWGENLPFDRIPRPGTEEAYYRLLDKVRESGCHISINHPFDRKLSWKINRDTIEMDSVEVWNSPMHTDNIYCYEWWLSKLEKGEFIPAVGGSDYHQDYAVTRLLGIPTKYVYAESNSVEDVLGAIKRGNVTVANSPNAAALFLSCGEAVSGDRVKLDENSVVRVSTSRLKKGQTLRVFNNRKVIYEMYARKTLNDFVVDIPVAEKGFVLAEVKYTFPDIAKTIYAEIAGGAFGVHDKGEDVPDMLYSFTNPIFFE